MADPWSVASSIAGLISIDDTAFRRLYHYTKTARNAEKEIIELKSKVAAQIFIDYIGHNLLYFILASIFIRSICLAWIFLTHRVDVACQILRHQLVKG